MLLIQNLGLHFAGNYLFSEVNFRVNARDKIGLAGKNGAGKSTLLKMLAGEQSASEGNITHEGKIKIGYLKQDIEFSKGKTVWNETREAFTELIVLQHNIDEISHQLTIRTDYETESYHKLIDDLTLLNERYQILGGFNVEAEMEKVLLGLGFTSDDFHRLTDEFSGGWRMRIELAKLLLQQNDVLLLDEPTNHLDIESIIWLEQFLQNYNGAIILVSHDIQFLSSITNRTIEISNKSIQDYKANYHKFLILRKERKEKLQQAQKNQQDYIKHTEMLIDKFRAKQSKASMAQSLIKKLDRIDRIEIEDEDVSKFNIRFEPSVNSGKIVFEAHNLGKFYENKKVFSEAEFFIERGKKIAFVGQNGQGKTTLAKMLAGILDYNGELKTGHNVQIGYFAQNQEDILNGNQTVLQEAENAATEETRTRVRSLLGAFLFRGDEVEKKVKVLSGGERNRLALCKLLLRPFNTLIMDEPTNHLDIQSKEIIKLALKKFEGTLIIVSHDREFLEGLADTIYEFRNGKVKEFLGNISEYLAYRKKETMREVELEKSKQIITKEPEKINTQEQSKEHKQLQNKINKIEHEIAETELKIAQLEKEFLTKNPTEKEFEIYNNTKQLLQQLMQDWEEKMQEIN